MFATVLVWVVIGGAVGSLGSLIVRRGAYGLVGDIAVGVVGALAGGFLWATFVEGASFPEFDPIGFLCAFAGASASCGLNHVQAWWQARRDGAPPIPVEPDLRAFSESIPRMELLMWRFSEGECERLCKLQRRYRDRPDMLDLPLDERRLRFARWMVDHGRLSEDAGAGSGAEDAPPWEQEHEQEREAPEVVGPKTRLRGPSSPSGVAASEPEGTPEAKPGVERPQQGHEQDQGHPGQSRRVVRRALSWIRQGIEQSATMNYGPGYLGYPTADGGPMDSYGNGRWYHDPEWIWMLYRHD
jgi:uncharacterized membrane protein YeaQ/YmgE (transglycosylase-associated protein family)